jgi:hypothetical protein
MRRLWALLVYVACVATANAADIKTMMAAAFKETCMAAGSPAVAAEEVASVKGWRKGEGSGQPRTIIPNSKGSFVPYSWLIHQTDDPRVSISVSILETDEGFMCSVAAEGQLGSTLASELVAELAIGEPRCCIQFAKEETILFWDPNKLKGARVHLRTVTIPSEVFVELTSIRSPR